MPDLYLRRIANGNVLDAGAIAPAAIGSSEIAANAIGNSQIAANAIDASKITTASITAIKFGAGAIDAASINAECHRDSPKILKGHTPRSMYDSSISNKHPNFVFRAGHRKADWCIVIHLGEHIQ